MPTESRCNLCEREWFPTGQPEWRAKQARQRIDDPDHQLLPRQKPWRVGKTKEDINHRTYGETPDCAGCRYWSEMIAMAHGGPVKAMCIAPAGSPKRIGYTNGRDTCSAWASGYDGAIDEPGSDPGRYETEPE
jgi:hypothetical protein